MSTGIGEFDRVLGGGVVPGSLVLVGGEPGIGKSTLLLQAAAHFARDRRAVLYSSGEESEQQIKSRGERLGVDRAPLYLLAETWLERILEEIARLKPALRDRRLDPDRLLAASSSRRPAASARCARRPRSCCSRPRGRTSRRSSSATSPRTAGSPGPKALEHIVDTVLYFEGEKHHAHRVVRAVKNRFGAVSELGVFEMTGTGLQRRAESVAAVPGRAAGRTRPARRCCAASGLAADARRGAGARQHEHVRQRAAHGERLDPNRLSLLLAVLEKRAGLNLLGDDVYVNVAGGIDGRRAGRRPRRSSRPSPRASATGRSQSGTAVFGEVGLAGEVRGISAGGAARARGRADGLHPLRRARTDNCAPEDLPAAASSSP